MEIEKVHYSFGPQCDEVWYHGYHVYWIWRDGVPVRYNYNWPDLPCKPYPLVYKRRGRGGINPTNHNTPKNIVHWPIVLTEVQTYVNPCALCVHTVLHAREHPYSQISSQTTTVGAHHGAHMIWLHEINGVSIYRQVSSLWQNHLKNEGSIVQDWDRGILDEAKMCKHTYETHKDKIQVENIITALFKDY
jgi:hypothetical protein